MCIDKAEEIVKIVCDVIAPMDAQGLFSSLLKQPDDQNISEELKSLMTAFASAPTRRLKLQILSIYAHKYPVNTLMKLHEPYGRITKWQIKKARLNNVVWPSWDVQETEKKH